MLVVRDFISALYELYPEISSKGNAGNMAAAIEYMNRICTYDPLYITSKVNSGELIISLCAVRPRTASKTSATASVSKFFYQVQSKRENGTPSSLFCRLPETGGYAP